MAQLIKHQYYYYHDPSGSLWWSFDPNEEEYDNYQDVVRVSYLRALILAKELDLNVIPKR